MAVEIATAYVNLVPSAKGIAGNIARELAPVEAAAAATGARAGKNLGGTLRTGFGSKIAGFAKAATLPLVGIGVAAFASAKGLEDAQNTILRTTGLTGKAASRIEASFKRVAANTPASFATVASTMATLSQRTGLTGKSLEDLTLQIVTFNRITKDSPIAVADLTKALSAFNIPGKNMGKVLDRLFVTSQKTGVPLAELVSTLQSAGPTVRQFGFPIETAAGLLATLNKAGVDAGPTIFALRKAFTTFAKEGKEPRKALEGVIGQIGKLVKAGDIAGARKLGVQLFGARGVGLVDAAVNGKLSLDTLTKSFDATGDGIRKTASRTSTLSAKFGVLKNNAELALAELGTPVIETLNSALKGALPSLKKFTAGFASLPDSVQKTTIGLIAIGIAVGPVKKLALAIKTMSLNVAGAGKSLAGLAVGTARLAKAAILGAINIARQTAAFVAQKVAMVAGAVATKALAVAQGILNVVMDANPIVLVVAAIAALAVGIFIAYKKFKPFRDVVDAVGRALAAVFQFVRKNWKLLLLLLIAPFIAVPLILVKFRSQIVKGISAAFSALVGFIKSHWKLLAVLLVVPFLALPIFILKKFGPQILGALAKIPPLLGKLGLFMLKALGAGVVKGIRFLAVALIGVPLLLAILFVRLQVFIVQKGVELIVGLARGLISALPAIASFFVSLPGKIQGFVGDLTTLLAQKALDLLIGFLQAEERGLPIVALFFASLPGRIIGFIGDVVTTLVPKGIDLVLGLLRGLAIKNLELVQFFLTLPGKIIGFLGDTASTLIPKGINLIEGLIVGVLRKLVDVTRFFVDLPGKILRALPDVTRLLFDIGKDIVLGLLEGMKDKALGAGSFIKKNVVDPIKDFIANPFGVFSPSTWARDVIGKNIMVGLAQGLTRNVGIVRGSIDSVVGDVKTGLTVKPGTFAISAAAPAAAAPAVVHIENLYADGRDKVGKVIADQQRRQYMLSTL